VFFRKKNNTNHLSDAELIEQYQRTGDAYYAGELFQRYSHLVFGVSMKYLKNTEESRDAVMNIFEKLLKDLHKHKVVHFKSWLYAVARNHCLMYLRTQKGTTFFSTENTSEFMEIGYDWHPIEEPLPEKVFGKLDICLENLVEEQKKCVQLFFLQEKCYKEVSEITGYEVGKVKSYIQNGKRNLKLCMERN
jgi:RNA polymerase sigma factor (sigma-70 family)